MGRRIAWTLAALAAAALALSGIADDAGQRQADAAFKRALVTFAVARTLNGAISVAQGTEVALEPAGVGVVLTVGEILDPINDLVERFSTVMLVATSSLGLQNILLRMTGWWGTSAALLAAVAFTGLATWWPRLRGSAWEAAAIRVLLVTIFLRFAMPLLVFGSNLVFDTFLAAEQAAATQALEATRSDIEEISQQPPSPPRDEEAGVLEQLGQWLDESLAAVDVRDRIDRLRERVSRASEHIINLIVIFLLQTLILPLVFLWLIVELLKSLGARAVRL